MADFQGHCLDDYSDEQLAHFIQNSARLPDHAGIALLSKTHIAKTYRTEKVEDASRALELACSLGVRVPRIRRTVMIDGFSWCISDRVPGLTLEEAWAYVGWIQSLSLAFQLRGFIQHLRSATSTTAGSLVTGICRSFWLDDRYGLPLRATADNIYAFVNFWSQFTSPRREIAKTPAQHRQPPPLQHLPPNNRLVFTHHDLAPRNIILDPSGQLWLLDWDYAGYYPSSFEYAAMNNFDIPSNWNRWARLRWRWFCWIAAGRYDKEMRVLRLVRSTCFRYRNFRRFHIKAGGYASAAARVSDSD